MGLSVRTKRTREEESEIVAKNLPFLQKLMKSDKLTTKEKLLVLQDVNVDLEAFLMSIGEEV